MAASLDALTLASTLEQSQQASTHFEKRCRKRQRLITSCKSLSLVGTCMASEKRSEGRKEEEAEGAKGAGLGGSGYVFKTFFVLDPHQFFTLAWLQRWSMWHVFRHCRGQQEKHMAFGIIRMEANTPVDASSPLSFFLSGSYRCLARWHGILLLTICLRVHERLFSLLGKHMPVSKVAATWADFYHCQCLLS